MLKFKTRRRLLHYRRVSHLLHRPNRMHFRRVQSVSVSISCPPSSLPEGPRPEIMPSPMSTRTKRLAPNVWASVCPTRPNSNSPPPPVESYASLGAMTFPMQPSFRENLVLSARLSSTGSRLTHPFSCSGIIYERGRMDKFFGGFLPRQAAAAISTECRPFAKRHLSRRGLESAD